MSAAVVQSPAAGRPSWMLPHEHGAYVQLGVPLFTALWLTRLSPVGVPIALGAMLLFASHEPVIILLGQRGGRILSRDGAAAKKALAWRAGFGIVSLAAAAMALGSVVAFAPAVLLGAVLMGLVWKRREKTAAGEVLAAFATCAWSLPALVAGGFSLPRAAAVALVLALSLTAPVFAIRAVIFGNKPRASRARVQGRALVGVVLSTSAAVLLAFISGLGLLAALAPIPLVFASVLYVAKLPSPRQLKRLGWTMATASLALPALLIAALV